MALIDGWIEVFRAGDYGAKGSFSQADVAAIARSYNPSYHEAPNVIGHPRTDAPAHGWVEGLKAQGGVLLAKLKQTPAEFRSLVDRGAFKKRSVSLYKDLDGHGPYLRHVGWLGAEPPAVKGLAPAFGEDDSAEAVELEFEETTEGMRMTIEEVRKAISDALVNFAEQTGLKKKPGDQPADLTTAVEAAVAKQAAALETKFAEERKALDAKVVALETAAAAASKSTGSKDAAAFCEGAVKAGRMTAAQRPRAEALLASLAGETAELEFSEGDGDKAVTKKGTAAELFQQCIEAGPKVVDYGERTGDLKGGLGSSSFNASGKADVVGIDVADRAVEISDKDDVEFGEALKRAERELATTA